MDELGSHFAMRAKPYAILTISAFKCRELEGDKKDVAVGISRDKSLVAQLCTG